MNISIVILNYRSAGLTRQCVKGIFDAQLKLSMEVIVVDNASQDNLMTWLTEYYPQVVQVKLPKNVGFAAGNNAGIKVASGDYILVLNPDITVLPGKIEQLFNFMVQHPQCGLAGPKLINPDGSLQYSAYQFPNFWLPIFRRTILGNIPALAHWLKNYQLMNWDHLKSRPVDWMLGACLIARREAVAQVGLMDERFFLYVEDTDWCRRFWQKQWQVWYVADVELVHFHERLSAQRPFLSSLVSRITWIHISSWLKYFYKWRNIKLSKFNQF